MQSNTVYDVIGIGIGPFNLGMAALTDAIPELKCLFVDQHRKFSWHPGLMLDNARLQVPFYADLVTLADPCSRFSYMAFLKAKQRLFRFAIHENNFITRREYNEYCRWTVEQLDCLVFGKKCETIEFDESSNVFFVHCRDVDSNVVSIYSARRIVIGTGTSPVVPAFATPLVQTKEDKTPGHAQHDRSYGVDAPIIIHSSNYLDFKELLLTKKNLTIVGSGQSAAEIFYDLLQHCNQVCNGISWFTRAERFYPMEYSKLTLEMTSPDYIRYFYGLAADKKKQILSNQAMLYKGINFSLINAIYDELYLRQLSVSPSSTGLFSNSELKRILTIDCTKLELEFYHSELEQTFTHVTEGIILATGYSPAVPDFIYPITARIQWNANKQYQVNKNYSIDSSETIFVQNAEMHSHGFNAPDLGMGPFRNAVILNCILGYEHYQLEKQISFQTFGIPTSPASP